MHVFGFIPYLMTNMAPHIQFLLTGHNVAYAFRHDVPAGHCLESLLNNMHVCTFSTINITGDSFCAQMLLGASGLCELEEVNSMSVHSVQECELTGKANTLIRSPKSAAGMIKCGDNFAKIDIKKFYNFFQRG